MTIDTVLLVAALVLFLAAAAGIESRVNLVALGLAAFVATFLV